MPQQKNTSNTFTRKQLIQSCFVSDETPPTFYFSLYWHFPNLIKLSSPLHNIPPMYFSTSNCYINTYKCWCEVRTLFKDLMVKITPHLGYASISSLPTPNFTGNFFDVCQRSRKKQAFIQPAKEITKSLKYLPMSWTFTF